MNLEDKIKLKPIISTLDIVNNVTANLIPVGAQTLEVGNDFLLAEEAFEAQYKEMLQKMRYDEVLAALGPNGNYHPCDDYSAQCALTCTVYDDCPKKEVPEVKEKEVAAGGSTDQKPKPKKKKRKKKK